MARHIELNPLTHLTIGTVGPPGQRVFYLQGSKGPDLISLIIEKQQASMLASSLESLLEELAEKHPLDEDHETVWTDMRLREPIEPLFRVGNLGLGYNEEVSRIVIVSYELVEEDEEPNVVSFWSSRTQSQALVKHAIEAVEAAGPFAAIVDSRWTLTVTSVRTETGMLIRSATNNDGGGYGLPYWTGIAGKEPGVIRF